MRGYTVRITNLKEAGDHFGRSDSYASAPKETYKKQVQVDQERESYLGTKAGHDTVVDSLQSFIDSGKDTAVYEQGQGTSFLKAYSDNIKRTKIESGNEDHKILFVRFCFAESEKTCCFGLHIDLENLDKWGISICTDTLNDTIEERRIYYVNDKLNTDFNDSFDTEKRNLDQIFQSPELKKILEYLVNPNGSINETRAINLAWLLRKGLKEKKPNETLFDYFDKEDKLQALLDSEILKKLMYAHGLNQANLPKDEEVRKELLIELLGEKTQLHEAIEYFYSVKSYRLIQEICKDPAHPLRTDKAFFDHVKKGKYKEDQILSLSFWYDSDTADLQYEKELEKVSNSQELKKIAQAYGYERNFFPENIDKKNLIKDILDETTPFHNAIKYFSLSDNSLIKEIVESENHPLKNVKLTEESAKILYFYYPALNSSNCLEKIEKIVESEILGKIAEAYEFNPNKLSAEFAKKMELVEAALDEEREFRALITESSDSKTIKENCERFFKPLNAEYLIRYLDKKKGVAGADSSAVIFFFDSIKSYLKNIKNYQDFEDIFDLVVHEQDCNFKNQLDKLEAIKEGINEQHKFEIRNYAIFIYNLNQKINESLKGGQHEAVKEYKSDLFKLLTKVAKKQAPREEFEAEFGAICEKVVAPVGEKKSDVSKPSQSSRQSFTSIWEYILSFLTFLGKKEKTKPQANLPNSNSFFRDERKEMTEMTEMTKGLIEANLTLRM